MKKQLRPYQEEIVAKLKKRLKEVTHPLLVTASVGSGKSIVISEILLWIERSGYRALCLTLNSTLIRQNADTYKAQQGRCGIYCAGLNSKDTDEYPVIFGSPQSVAQAIRNKDKISYQKFNLIVIDECHNVSFQPDNTLYQRIINHFGSLAQSERYSYRVLGLTGTPWRGVNSIIGQDKFFKEEICNISTSWLITKGYLTKPVFGLPEAQGYDFSKIRVNSMGKFSGNELQAALQDGERLTGQIARELQEVMKTRKAAFIFCCTKRHCEETARSLPSEQTRIITAETPHEERREILEQAKELKVRYLINVSVLLTGVDLPIYDTIVFLRPTESLVLFTQALGRGLRLHEDKTECLVLDFAGNLERFQDEDDNIINEALQPKEEDEHDYIIPCLQCASLGISVLNKVSARRCIGIHNGKRCDYYFEWKDCPHCSAANDRTSKACRSCAGELIDPNAKLSLKPAVEPKVVFDVVNAKYWVQEKNGHPSINAMYNTKQGLRIYETFVIRDERIKNIFYGMWVKHHFLNSSQFYPVLMSILHVRKMIESPELRTPHQIECKFVNNKYQISRRFFHEE